MGVWSKLSIGWSKFWYSFRQETGVGSWVDVQKDFMAEGIVTAMGGFQLDGDRCFDIHCDAGQSFHCEIMPAEWYGGLNEKAKGMKVGSRVKVVGLEAYDPPHLGNKQELEIHPVTFLEIL